MNTIYTEQFGKTAKIFRRTGNRFEPVEEISVSSESTPHAELWKKFSPKTCCHAVHSDDFAFWEHIKKSHNPLDWITKTKEGETVCHSFDYRLELLLSALSHPKICERQFQEGVTLIFEEDCHVIAVLAYKNEIYGAFEHSLKNLDNALLKKNLEEFRFGWLPDEEVRKQNGGGCILKNIPAEAEGFRPTFIFCEHKERFSELGRLLHLENTKETTADLLTEN